jgi:predicted nuclease of predicted toxin-antitoxin system
VKLLLDEGLPLTTASLLRAGGFDAVHTSELGMAAAEDEEILKRAAEEDRIVFTLDADFTPSWRSPEMNGHRPCASVFRGFAQTI